MDTWRQLAAAQDLARLPNKRPALKALETLLAESPDNADALVTYSHCLLVTGRVAEAQGAARRALELEPESPSALAQLGWALYVRGDDKGAGVCADAAIAADPDDSSGWWLRVDWALFTKRPSKAEDAARQLLVMHPGDADAHAYLGRARLARGVLAGAREALTEALRLDPEHGVARRALAATVVREAHSDGAKPMPERGPRRWLRQVARAGRQPGARAVRLAALALGILLGAASLHVGRGELLPAVAMATLAALPWASSIASRAAAGHVRARGIVAVVALAAALGASVALGDDASPRGAGGALFGLALWAWARGVAQVAGIGRSAASLAAEIDPSFGVDPGAYKTEMGFELLRRGESDLARHAFRGIGQAQEYSPTVADGRQLATVPEWSALLPGTVGEESWARAPERLRVLRSVLTAASCLAFAVGCWHAVAGRPWYALLHAALIALGATLAATGFDLERRRPMRVIYLLSGAFVALWPLAVLVAPAAARWRALEAAVYAVLAARFLMTAGDVGERLDGDTNTDPTSGDPWKV